MLATGVGRPTEVYMIEPTHNHTDEAINPITKVSEEMIDTMAADQVVPPGYIL